MHRCSLEKNNAHGKYPSILCLRIHACCCFLCAQDWHTLFQAELVVIVAGSVVQYVTGMLCDCRDKLFPESVIRNVIYQVLQGLAFMHKHGESAGLGPHILLLLIGLVVLHSFNAAVAVSMNLSPSCTYVLFF